MQVYRPRRPAKLTLSQAAEACRPYTKDPYFPYPSRTPTSATFFQTKFSSDVLDHEGRRNTRDLQTGAFFNNSIVNKTDTWDLPHNLNVDPLLFSEQTHRVVCDRPPTPKNATFLSEIHQKFADAHNGVYPKVGLFTEDSEVKDVQDDGEIDMGNEDTFTDSDSSDEIHSPPLATEEEEVPLIKSEAEDEEDEQIATHPLQPKHQKSRSFSPVSHDNNEDAEGEVDDDDNDNYSMSDSSGKDDDDGSDEDFVDPSYSTFYNQQRRALAQFEKNSSTSSSSSSTKNKKHQTHTPVAKKTISSPKYTSSSSSSSSSSTSSSPVSTPPSTPPSSAPSSPPSSPASSPSSRKRKARPSSNEDEANSKAEDPDSPSHSDMYTIIREKCGKTSYQCNLCPEVRTKAFGDMKRHLESLKHKPPSHRCDPAVFGFGCGKVFTRNDALKRHMIGQHPMQWAMFEADNLHLGPSRKRVKTA